VQAVEKQGRRRRVERGRRVKSPESRGLGKDGRNENYDRKVDGGLVVLSP
jgi:hypothetical protein